jgi:hypothetical protein
MAKMLILKNMEASPMLAVTLLESVICPVFSTIPSFLTRTV